MYTATSKEQIILELNLNKFRSQLKSANLAARTVLQAVFGSGKPADRVLSAWLRENRQCGSRDRQFIGEAVYAMLRYWGLLRKFLPAERLAEIERGEIRLARLELDALLFAALYLDYRNLPAADAIARELGFPWPKPDREARNQLLARAGALGKIFGVDAVFADGDLLPQWIASRLPEELDRERFLADLAARPPMWLRMQTAETDHLVADLSAAGLAVSRHGKIADAVAVTGRVNLFTLDAFRNGLFEVQDLASQCIGLAAAPRPGERWLDACAGAGGKTLQLAALMNRTGTVVATDIRSYKLDDLRTRARRAGFPNIRTREWDGKPYQGKQAARFDGVLVDAPCSCSGVWRRNPDGRWTLKEEELADITRVQLEVLTAAAPAVKPGGVLIYATCSLFPEENGGVLERFLAAHPEYTLEDFPNPLTGEPTGGTLQVFSYDGDCDSMFVARMRRQEALEDAAL